MPRSRSRLGMLIDDQRAEAGQTIAQVADALGIGRGTLANARFKGAKFTERVAEALADYTRLDVATVMDASAEPGGTDRTRIIHVETYPLVTAAGTSYAPPVNVKRFSGCPCQHEVLCRRMVNERDGFALCERVIEADLLPDEVSAHVAETMGVV